MSFLKRWKASKTNLVGPDFDKADWLEINLSGTTVKFKNPSLTAMIPYHPPITNIDIYNNHALEPASHKEELSDSQLLCDNGWNFYSGLYSDSAVGGIIIDLVLIKATTFENKNNSFFDKHTFIDWNLEQTSSVYNAFNLDIEKDYEESSSASRKLFFKYPANSKEITEQNYNNHLWLKYRIYKPGGSETIVYRTAIEDNYLLSLTIKPDCYHDDIDSPAHNLPKVISEAIESLMQSMHVSLSPVSRKQYETANPKLLEKSL